MPAQRKVWIAAVAVALFCAIVTVQSRVARPTSSEASAGEVVRSLPYNTEAEWLIAQAIAEMARAALKPDVLAQAKWSVTRVAGDAAAYAAVLTADRPLKTSLTFDYSQHIWAAEAYLPLARDLRAYREEPGTTRAPGTPLGRGLQALLKIDDDALEAENRRVSAWLHQAPSDPEAHEAAALLLAALAFTEDADAFSDTRSILSRVAGRLAFAQALREGGSGGRTVGAQPVTALASAIVEVLAGRSKSALQRLDQIDSGAHTGLSEVAAWRNAIRLRATGDWRLLGKPKGASELEEREYLRALQQSRGSTIAVDRFREIEPTPSPGFLRAALGASNLPSAGNVLTDAALDIELAAAARTWSRQTNRSFPSPAGALAPISDACLTAPASPHTDDVLPPALWACYLQRHLLAALWRADRHRAVTLGLSRDDLAEFRHANAYFLDLAPYAFLTLARTEPSAELGEKSPKLDTKAIKLACTAAAHMVVLRPDLVTPSNWNAATQACRQARAEPGPPDIAQWFEPAIPPGTGYEAADRLALGTDERYSVPELQTIQELEVYEPRLLRFSAYRKDGRQPTAAEFGRAYGAVADYNQFALQQWVDLVLDDIPEELRLRTRLCKMSADECGSLGELQAWLGRDNDAAVAYERLLAQADPLAASQSGDWIVDHYLQKGELGKATAVAQHVARVYSATGLQTRARLFERLGQFEKAEAGYELIADRYRDSTELQWFYIRQQRRYPSGRYAAQGERAMAQLFPGGLARVDTIDPATLPSAKGADVRQQQTRNWMGLAGVRAGDTVLGRNGYRVSSWDQWRCVGTLDDQPTARILVRRGKSLLTIESKDPGRLFGPIEP